MQPIEPKRYKNYFNRENQKVEGTEDMDDKFAALLEDTQEFSLYIHNMRGTKYFSCKDSILVIGLNNITKAFLRSLIFCWSDTEYVIFLRFYMNYYIPYLNTDSDKPNTTIVCPPTILR